MVEPGTVFLLAVAVLASFFAAWTIGAGSTGATPFAPAVGANAISIMQATFFVGFLGFAGAVLQGAAITETIGRGLIGGVNLSPLAATVALTIAAAYIAAGVFKGYPIATAFAITGSVVGVGLAMGGDPVWSAYAEITLYWVLTPVVVAPPAYWLTKLLRSGAIPQEVTLAALVGVVMVVIANMGFLVLGPPDEQGSIALSLAGVFPVEPVVGRVLATGLVAFLGMAVMWRSVTKDAVAAQRYLLLSLGGLVAFTAGGGKVGLAVGPLLPLLDETVGTAPITWVLVFGAFGILLGSWMLAPRMVWALSQDYSQLGPNRSISVLIPSFVIAQIGIFFGLPMSFNEIFISAIAGTGYAVGSEHVSQEKIKNTVLVWVGSIIFSLVVGFAVYTGISMATGIR